MTLLTLHFVRNSLPAAGRLK